MPLKKNTCLDIWRTYLMNIFGKAQYNLSLNIFKKFNRGLLKTLGGKWGGTLKIFFYTDKQ